MSQAEGGAYTELRNMANGREEQRGCCRGHPLCCGATLIFAVVISSIVAVGLGLAYRPVRHKVDDIIESKVVLTQGSAAIDNFLSSEAPLYSKYHFFNVMNPKDVEAGAKPNVEDIGPFIYRENRTKFDPSWNEDETELEYTLNTTYTYDSGHDPQQPITTINLPLIGVLLTIEAIENNPDIDKHLRELIDIMVDIIDEFKKTIGWEGLFVTHTVDEWLWGYEDELLKLLHAVAPQLIPTSVFGLSKRSELQYPNRVYTGKGNLSRVAEFIEWNNRTNIDEWGTETAGMINGTGGFQFHPGVSRNENLTAFISELFRSGYFSYERDASIYGIETYQFGIPMVELSNKSQDPGFFSNGPSGVLNLTAVSPNNVSLFASKPHFLDGDPGYRENVTGLEPNRSLHDSFLNVEPLTGASLGAAKRIQINLRLQPYRKIPEVKEIMEVMLPVFWASEEGSLTVSLADEFKQKVYGVEYAIEGGILAAIGLAGLIIVLSVMCIVGLVFQQRKGRGTRRVWRAHDDEHAPLLTAGGGGVNTDIQK